MSRKSLKILLYNFATPGDGNPAAGGVGVYLSSLSKALYDRGDFVVQLSSGHDYSPWTTKPYVAFSGKGRYMQAKIINSPVIAPAHDAFFSPEIYLDSTQLDIVPELLKQRFGELDVLHFQNIEGLTASFFKQAREAFPLANILLSAHNYNTVCSQVNLWKNDRVSCVDYENGRACVSCIPIRSADFKKRVRAAWWLRATTRYLPKSWTAFLLRRRGLPDDEQIHSPFNLAPNTKVVSTAELAQSYRKYRAKNIELASTVFNFILAVSEQTKTVLINNGIKPQNIIVSYIGSSHVLSGNFTKRLAETSHDLHVAYLGYARRDKGFEFLLRAFEQLPNRISRHLEITIAAKLTDARVINRISRLGRRFASVNIINGYDAQNLPILLHRVDLGIVPPIWEDNLPQVAIEFVANGVPILTSNAGGASEIGRNPSFIFEASSIPSFIEALRRIVDGEVALADFWRSAPNIRNFSAHLDELLALYVSPDKAGSFATHCGRPFDENLKPTTTLALLDEPDSGD